MIETTCDVLVVGGGVAGTTAAIAAAREGAYTILVEQEKYLGGAGYAGMFQHICGLYLNDEKFPADTLNAGITREIIGHLKQKTPGKKERQIGRVFVLPYNRRDLLTALETLCIAEKKLTILREWVAQSALTVGGEVKTVTVGSKNGKKTISANMVIDCSGNGDIAASAGTPYELSSPDERQLAGYIINLKGISNVDEALSVQVPYHLRRAVQQGLLPPLSRLTTFSIGDGPDEGYCKMSVEGNDSPERNKSARENADVMLKYLGQALPAFKQAWVAGTSLKVLDREGRRICGEYMITEEDILSARKFPDGVVKSAWPIEIWNAATGTTYKYVPKGDYYEIAFRCMIAKGLLNLLCAGRCISATHTALGSTRVMGTCMALGEQAGRAAAYQVVHGRYPTM